jgi:hypothetical protein
VSLAATTSSRENSSSSSSSRSGSLASAFYYPSDGSGGYKQVLRPGGYPRDDHPSPPDYGGQQHGGYDGYGDIYGGGGGYGSPPQPYKEDTGSYNQHGSHPGYSGFPPQPPGGKYYGPHGYVGHYDSQHDEWTCTGCDAGQHMQLRTMPDNSSFCGESTEWGSVLKPA